VKASDARAAGTSVGLDRGIHKYEQVDTFDNLYRHFADIAWTRRRLDDVAILSRSSRPFSAASTVVVPVDAVASHPVSAPVRVKNAEQTSARKRVYAWRRRR